MVNLKATLFDGSYHPVDSSEMAFKTAVQIAYKTGMPQASPTLLEPIGALKVTIPDNYMGDVIGDLNKRRGRVMGMNPDGEGNQIVEAEVPMAEMSRYAIDLRSMTQGRGSFTFRFVRYEEAPPAAQEKAIEAAKAIQDEAPEAAESYMNAARALLRALDEHCADWTEKTPAVLTHCTSAYHDEAGHHIAMDYGDYFFIEGVRKLAGETRLFWKPLDFAK